MAELWILEIIVLLFLFLAVSRPLIKRLWPLDGLVWLPLLSLGITLGLYPAYGFRPETLPLVFFEILLVFFHLPAMGATLMLRPSDAYRDRSSFFTVMALFLCAAAGFLSLAFAPKTPAAPPGEAQTLAVRDEGRGRDYFLRIYRPAEQSGALPLLFVIPPEAGSVSSVDWVCAGLRDRGFTVITYSRRAFDFPALGTDGRRYFCSPAQVYRLWTAFRNGFRYQTANDRGRALEAARMEDIEFLLPHVVLNRGDGALPLVMAGYGAGGAALVQMSDSPPGQIPWNGQVRGIAAVEPGLWRLYRAGAVAAGGRTGIGGWFAGLRPQKISGLAPVPRPDLPALYLVSSRVRAERPGKDPYGALRETLRNSPQPAALAYLDGAGPLDYTDHPLVNPVYPALFPGEGGGGLKGRELIDATVAIIGNFSALLADAPLRGGEPIPGLYVETRSWNLPDLQDILIW
ncbi:MAG: hypothetical protein LBK27_01505 [Treponema sp.]|jgi:hypothetical protein|nr:hypothetical protein [Treponema sp.]